MTKPEHSTRTEVDRRNLAATAGPEVHHAV